MGLSQKGHVGGYYSRPSSVRDWVRDSHIGDNGCIVTDEQIQFAAQLFKENPLLAVLRKKDFYYTTKEGRRVVVTPEDKALLMDKGQLSDDDFTLIRKNLPFRVMRDGRGPDAELFAIYTGRDKERNKHLFWSGSEAKIKLRQSLTGSRKSEWSALKGMHKGRKNSPALFKEEAGFVQRMLKKVDELEILPAQKSNLKALINDLFILSGPVVEGFSEERLAYGMPLADTSLEERLQALQREKAPHHFQFRQAVEMAHRLIQAVLLMHQLGFVHRDIKVANILLYGDTVKLTDFGLASSVAEQAKGLGSRDSADAGALAEAFKTFMQLKKLEKLGDLRKTNPKKEELATLYKKIDVFGLGIALWKLFGVSHETVCPYEAGDNASKAWWKQLSGEFANECFGIDEYEAKRFYYEHTFQFSGEQKQLDSIATCIGRLVSSFESRPDIEEIADTFEAITGLKIIRITEEMPAEEQSAGIKRTDSGFFGSSVGHSEHGEESDDEDNDCLIFHPRG